MGCSDEKSISNKPIKRNHRNNNFYDKNDKDAKNAQKINLPEDEDIKEESKHIETEQEQNTIKFVKEEENKEIDKKENGNENNIINDIKESKNNINDKDEEDDDDDDDSKENEEQKDQKDEEEEEEEEEEEDIEEEDVNREMIRQLSPYLQAKVNPNFNFPEVKVKSYVGKGLRRMKGYISIVPKEELLKRREAFWGTRIEGDPQVWNFLKEICDLPVGEEDNMPAMLEANEITPLKKCINVTYDKSGEVYEIPNYCINDPVCYDYPEMHVKKPEKKSMCFHVRKGAEQIKIKAFNTTSVDAIKSNVAKKIKVDENKIRLFFRGKEMKNGNELWLYNVEDECVIIIMCS